MLELIIGVVVLVFVGFYFYEKSSQKGKLPFSNNLKK